MDIQAELSQCIKIVDVQETHNLIIKFIKFTENEASHKSNKYNYFKQEVIEDFMLFLHEKRREIEFYLK